MPKRISTPQRLVKCLGDHFDNDSTFRLALAITAVSIYLGICLFVFYKALSGDLDFEDASELTRTWTLCVGPIVGTVVGFYFGGSLSVRNGSNGHRPLALIIALFFFAPMGAVAYLGATIPEVKIETARIFLEHWVLCSGPITGVVFGLYFSRELRVNDDSNSDEFRKPNRDDRKP